VNTEQFIKSIKEQNTALFKASQANVKEYFESKPSTESLVDHFIGRMVNERMNMVEISKQISEMPADTDPQHLTELTKQAMDEAKHFRMVKEVIEHITKKEVDVAAAIAQEEKMNTAKGASLLEKYGQEYSDVVLPVYQMIAEGRAEAVWDQMADSIEDTYISSRYRAIARDEGFHSKIGAKQLGKIALTEKVQEKVLKLANLIRKDLWEISCKNSVQSKQGTQYIQQAYAW
jgi:rubrerythrin